MRECLCGARNIDSEADLGAAPRTGAGTPSFGALPLHGRAAPGRCSRGAGDRWRCRPDLL